MWLWWVVDDGGVVGEVVLWVFVFGDYLDCWLVVVVEYCV